MTTQMVDESNFDNKQYKADLQCAYDCGYVKGQIDILEKINEKIDFEEKWLFDVFAKEYKIRTKDIEIAMSGIRRVVAELKGEQK